MFFGKFLMSVFLSLALSVSHSLSVSVPSDSVCLSLSLSVSVLVSVTLCLALSLCVSLSSPPPPSPPLGPENQSLKSTTHCYPTYPVQGNKRTLMCPADADHKSHLFVRLSGVGLRGDQLKQGALIYIYIDANGDVSIQIIVHHDNGLRHTPGGEA